MSNLNTWDSLKRPPKEALKSIGGGRLKGMTDINPQWRYKAMTEVFGVCGIGWKYQIVRLWSEGSPSDGLMAFAEILVYIKDANNHWSDGIPGIGGSALVAKEKGGLHQNDEGYKMATTDALSVALKMLGVGADIYAGRWDGSKYIDDTPPPVEEAEQPLTDDEIAAHTETINNQITLVALKKAWGVIVKIANEKEDLVGCKKLKEVYIAAGLEIQQRDKVQMEEAA